LSLLPQAKFHKELPIVILDEFAITRVNNVLRQVEGSSRLTARRGFHGLALNMDGTDAKDKPDVPDGSLNSQIEPF